MASEPPYPGTTASPAQVRLLADEYRSAALSLRHLGRPGEPISRAPFRLVAIHAIELYLNALLLHRGHEPARVRGLQHDLAKRARLAADAGLRLKAKTADHLTALARTREYLATRYAPELQAPSELTRLVATLEEVATKVGAELDGTTRRLRPRSPSSLPAPGTAPPA